MSRRTWFGLFLGLALLGVVNPSRASAESPSNLEDALAFRATYGLSTDPAYVKATEADPSSIRDYGVALTSGEEADLRRRDAIVDQLKPLIVRLSADSTFAGLYVDQSAGGVIDVATVGDPESVLKEASTLAPAGALLRSRRVEYTQHELTSLQDQVTADLPRLGSKGIAVATVGIDVVANRVRVEVPVLTASTIDVLDAAYGGALEVAYGELPSPASCTSRSACPLPNKGGLSIHGTVGGTTYYCTSAFSARDLNTRALYLYTAGHCIKDTGLNVTWYMGSTAIGPGTVQRFYNNTTADVGLIALTSSNRVPPLNQAYASSNLDVRSMGGWWADAQQVVGHTVCRSGASGGWHCGTIAGTNITVNVGGTVVLHQWKTNYTSSSGDSGGTMMDNLVNWMGVLSSINSTNTFYGTVDYAIEEPFGASHLLNPCVSSSC